MTRSADFNRQLVERFFESWGVSFDAMLAGFAAAMDPGCVLEQTRTPTLRGIDEILRFLRDVRAAGVFETIGVENRTIVATDRHVVSERTDRLIRADGAVTSTFPCVGVMEIADGRIVSWRDYFDSADMQAGGMDVVQAHQAS